MSAHYDAIVVGAGPSGSTAAITLARHGIRTLLVDKDEFPRVKACGDAVQAEAFVMLRELGMPDSWSARYAVADHVSILSPHGLRATVRLMVRDGEKVRIVTRHDFDQLLLNYAQRCGATYERAQVTAPLLDGGQVIGVQARQGKHELEFRAPLVIAADGATSAIRRGLGVHVHPEQHKAVSLRGYVETSADLDATIELAFPRDLLPGYGWIFPLGKRYANIGVGVRADVYRKNGLPLERYLDVYLNMPHIRALIGANPVHEVKSWQLPLCSFQQRRAFNGAILVGDAGGFVHPLTGAGIMSGMFTGKTAAEVGMEALNAGDVSAAALTPFEARWRKRLLRSMQIGTLAQRMLAWSPRVIDVTAWLGRAFPAVIQTAFAKA